MWPTIVHRRAKPPNQAPFARETEYATPADGFLSAAFGAFCTAAQQACTDAVSCNGVGTAAYQAGRSAEALEAFVRQLGFAEDADDSKAQELALNNLMLGSLKAGQNGMARAWMQRALRAGFEGEATRFNLAKVAAAAPASPCPRTPPSRSGSSATTTTRCSPPTSPRLSPAPAPALSSPRRCSR